MTRDTALLLFQMADTDFSGFWEEHELDLLFVPKERKYALSLLNRPINKNGFSKGTMEALSRFIRTVSDLEIQVEQVRHRLHKTGCIEDAYYVIQNEKEGPISWRDI